MRNSYLKITYSDQEDLASPESLRTLSTAAFPMNNADSGVLSLNLNGKTSNVLSFEMELRTKMLPAVTLKEVRKESRQLRYSAFTITTIVATDEDNIPSLFDFKNLREVFATNYYEGDPVTRFQITLPVNATAGSIISDVGGLKGVSIKCPALTRSPIINVMVPTFMLEGHPEVKALDFVKVSGHGQKPVRVAVDLKNTDWGPGQLVEINVPVGTLGKSRVLTFVCPRFNPKNENRIVMVVIRRDDEYFGSSAHVDHRTSLDGSVGDQLNLDHVHNLDQDFDHHQVTEGSNTQDSHKVTWETSPMSTRK